MNATTTIAIADTTTAIADTTTADTTTAIADTIDCDEAEGDDGIVGIDFSLSDDEGEYGDLCTIVDGANFQSYFIQLMYECLDWMNEQTAMQEHYLLLPSGSRIDLLTTAMLKIGLDYNHVYDVFAKHIEGAPVGTKYCWNYLAYETQEEPTPYREWRMWEKKLPDEWLKVEEVVPEEG